MNVARHLCDRADSYRRDSDQMAAMEDSTLAALIVAYRTVADELRKTAALIDAPQLEAPPAVQDTPGL